MRQDGRLWSGSGLGLAAGALWGTVFLAPCLLPGFSPLELTTVRYLAYGGVSAVLVATGKQGLWARLTQDDWRMLIWLSGIGNIVYYLCLVASIQVAGMVPASLVVGLLPVTIAVFGQRHRWSATWPLAVIGAGVIGINLDLIALGEGTTHGPFAGLGGIALAAGALGAWTAYALGNARYLKRHDRFTSHEWSLLQGVATGLLAILLVPVVVLTAGSATGTHDWTACLGVMSAVALGASLVGNGLWNAASRRLPPAVLGPMLVSETLFALIYGCFYKNRWPRPLELLAMAVLAVRVPASCHQHAEHARHDRRPDLTATLD